MPGAWPTALPASPSRRVGRPAEPSSWASAIGAAGVPSLARLPAGRVPVPAVVQPAEAVRRPRDDVRRARHDGLLAPGAEVRAGRPGAGDVTHRPLAPGIRLATD